MFIEHHKVAQAGPTIAYCITPWLTAEMAHWGEQDDYEDDDFEDNFENDFGNFVDDFDDDGDYDGDPGDDSNYIK